MAVYGSDPDPIFNEDSPTNWQLVPQEFYVRDVSGKEIAIYSDTTLQLWNFWGLDMVGHMNADTTKYYYLKDHLGSVRATINSTNTVVSAQDYDAWGYLLENRTYNNTSIKYDYTGKERDAESNYDYFGARYYDGRIGRWGQVEPLLDEYFSWSPYCYSLVNPILMKDVKGLDVYITGTDAIATVKALNESTTNNFFLAIDPQTGKVSVEGKGGNKAEQMLINAINDPNVQVNLKTTENNFEESEYGGLTAILVGAYDGSKIENNIVQTSQFFNLSHANLLESKGGPEAGLSALFELNESYIGGKHEKTKGKEPTEKTHNIAHKLAKKIQPKEPWFELTPIERRGRLYAQGRTKSNTFYFWIYNRISKEFEK
ncbi:MAG: hypothetical protein L0Y79_10900 [Chlorobi bacterium]|nr:hypothetical protein [Chlorobiota bacterium]MCI0715565.1 hypothetical protein [Chlorobiota bacterium]